MMTTDNSAELAKTRGRFYGLLSRLYENEPSESLLGRLEALSWPSDCPQKEMREGYRLLRNFFLESDPRKRFGHLATDYMKVFQGAGDAKGEAAYPYESVYTSREGLVMQEAWESAKAFYAANGLAPAIGRTDLKEDHLAVELGFMRLLCGEDPATPESLETQIAFMEEHLLNCSRTFCEDMAKLAETGFYKGLASLTVGFLLYDRELLEGLVATGKAAEGRGYSVSSDRMDAIFDKLKDAYAIYGPRLLKSRGANGKDVVRYQELGSVGDVVFDRPSDFSPKEVYFPIMQTMFYFGERSFSESVHEAPKPPLIFMRACDINALRRLDAIFLKNGEAEDLYYARRRQGMKIALMECETSHPNCFCASMGSNETSDYGLAVRFQEGSLLVQVKDPDLAPYFFGQKAAEFRPRFVKENEREVRLPAISGKAELKLASELEFWKEYDQKCVGCGGCNTVCPTCSCFDTVDVIYDETSREGERRRIWSSCMLDSFTLTAGGGRARQTPGANMRFKVLHKVHDFRERFGGLENMCVGCGRCVGRCSREIVFPDAVNRLDEELRAAKARGEGA